MLLFGSELTHRAGRILWRILDQRGIADRFLSQGKVMQVAAFAMNPLDINDFENPDFRTPTRFALLAAA